VRRGMAKAAIMAMQSRKRAKRRIFLRNDARFMIQRKKMGFQVSR